MVDLRLLATITAAALASAACGDKTQSAPASAAPAAGAVASIAPAAGFSLGMANPSVLTSVGTRTSDGLMSSSGGAGVLVYGPYLPVDAGKYMVRIHGKWLGKTGEGTATADVTTNGGTRKLAEVAIPHRANSGDLGLLLEFPLQLATREEGVELRVHVSQDARIAVQKYEIGPLK